MWPFFIKSKAPATETTDSASPDAPKRRQLSFQQLLDGMGNLSCLSTNDTALKFWLPEASAIALDELSKLQANSMSVTLREFFAVHTYGLYPVRLLLEQHPDALKDPVIRFSIDFDPRDFMDQPGKKRVHTYFVPELGKNTVPIKVWIASRLCDDLQTLADHAGIKLSQYVREIVISRLLGHGTLPKRPEMLTAAPSSAAEEWCNGNEVAMREGSICEYRLYADGEQTSELVDDYRDN